MDESTIVVPEATIPPVGEVDPTTVVVPPVVLPELRYEYQPTDENGLKLGGKQVILYRTPDELAEKLRDQNIELVRKLRQMTKKQRLGQGEAENLPADLDRLPKTVDFREKPLSIEERYAISQDLIDPAKFEGARDRLFESAIGVAPKEFREQQNQQQYTVNQLLARTNATMFIERHPEFYVCEENLGTVTDWMIKNGLQPTVKNFEVAHQTMSEAGLLLASPIVREEAPVPPVVTPPVASVENTLPNPQATAVPVTRISDSELPQEKRQAHVPSGLNSRTASNTGYSPETGALTLADIDRMSSDEYRRRIQTDPKFVDTVNKLEAARPPRPRRA